MDTSYLEKEIEKAEGEQEKSGDIPVIVKIISVLYYIISGGLGIGVIWVIYNFIRNSIIPDYNPYILMFIIPLVIFGGLGVWFFFVARGLWRRQKWSRINAVVFCILFFIFYAFLALTNSIISIVGSRAQGIISSAYTASIILVVNLFIAGYLLFNRRVKEAFS